MRKSIPVFGVIVTAMLLLSMTVYAEDEAMTFSSDEYEYTVDENGYATLTKYVGVDTDVAVPDSIDGHIVTGLGDSVFYVQQTEIRSIQLSRDIRDLGAYVFLSDTCRILRWTLKITISLPLMEYCIAKTNRKFQRILLGEQQMNI